MRNIMELNGFIGQLPVVFEILKNSPEKIVDDTALERLLNLLELSSKDEAIVKCALDFLKAKEIWDHEVTLSFALRFSGFLSCHCSMEKELQKLLKKVKVNKMFGSSSVQYGYYKCLTSLLLKELWWDELQDSFKTALVAFATSNLYVKKTAVDFLAIALQREYFIGLAIDHMKNNELSAEQRSWLVDSLTKLLEISPHSSQSFFEKLNFLSETLKHVVEDKSTQLLNCLICLLKTLSNSGVKWLEYLEEGDAEKTLLNFIKKVKSENALKMYFPSLCQSLMSQHEQSGFSADWNSILLEELLAEVLATNTTTATASVWKKSVVSVMNVMSRVETMHVKNHNARFLTKLNTWRLFVFTALSTSLGQCDEQINDYHISLISDPKISRLCCAYIKNIPIRDLDEDTRKKLITCVLGSLQASTHVSQIVSSLLDILALVVNESESSLSLMGDDLHEVLHRKMCDVGWEVKDSALNLLLKITEKAVSQDTSNSHMTFLRTHTFWCDLIPMLVDTESYIRARVMQLFAQLFTHPPLWKVFAEKNNMSQLDLWQRLCKDFASPLLQDDFFTRRAVLQLLMTTIRESQFFDTMFKQPNNTDSRDLSAIFCDIVRSSSLDFDWEVRKLTVSLWLLVFSIAVTENMRWSLDDILSSITKHNLSFSFLGYLCDDEYSVKQLALECYDCVREEFGEAESVITNLNTYEVELKRLTNITKESLTKFLCRMDVEALTCDLQILDEKVKNDAESFVKDIIVSAKEGQSNLLDCY